MNEAKIFTESHANDNIYYTPQALADRWGISKETVYQLLRGGKLKGFKLGRDWRITDEARIAYENDPDHSAMTVYRPRAKMPMRVV